MVQFLCPGQEARGRSLLGRVIALFVIVASFSQTLMAQDWVYTVRPGDSLWKISNDYLITPEYWVKVKALNNIDGTRLLTPGIRLTIPFEWLKEQPISAEIIILNGQVELIRGGDVIPLSSNEVLYLGDRVRTGENSGISIKFNDGSELIVFQNSEINLEILDVQKDEGLSKNTIKLIRGRIINKVVPQKKGSRYQINTPAAMATVRGTEFRVDVGSDGKVMRSEVLVGAVGVSGSGVTQNVTAGYATIATIGSPPITPIQLPIAPDLSSLSKHTSAQSPTYKWPALPDITRYRAQLALDEQFSQLVSELLLEKPQVSWAELIPSTYFMRIRGIDDQGIEGFNSLHTFTINEPLQAPNALTPRDGIRLNNKPPFIAWSNVEGVRFYLLQLASNQEFSQNLSEISGLVNNNFRPSDTLLPGQYYWRVQSISRHGDRSAFSTHRSFIVEQPNPQ